LDTYEYVEKTSYISNFLDNFLLKDKCLIIIYEYTKFMFFFVTEIYVYCMLCVIIISILAMGV
jgi:hypothetical protein